MIELKDFTKEDFDIFKSWITNEDQLFQFAGPIFTFPVTTEQLHAYIEMADKRPMKVILSETNEIIGHCELNFENGHNRLSRILVANKELRGLKIGEKIVREMVNICFEDKDVKEVDLNVFDWNTAAIKCYENVGFTINNNNTDQLEVNGKIWTRLNMVLKRN